MVVLGGPWGGSRGSPGTHKHPSRRLGRCGGMTETPKAPPVLPQISPNPGNTTKTYGFSMISIATWTASRRSRGHPRALLEPHRSSPGPPRIPQRPSKDSPRTFQEAPRPPPGRRGSARGPLRSVPVALGIVKKPLFSVVFPAPGPILGSNGGSGARFRRSLLRGGFASPRPRPSHTTWDRQVSPKICPGSRQTRLKLPQCFPRSAHVLEMV